MTERMSFHKQPASKESGDHNHAPLTACHDDANSQESHSHNTENREGNRTNLLSEGQLEAIRSLSSSEKTPKESRLHRFHRLHGKARADYFRQEFLWPLVGICLIVGMIVGIVTSSISSRSKKTGLQLISFDSLMSLNQEHELQKGLNSAHLVTDPVRVDTSFEDTGQETIKLRVNAATNSLDAIIATPSVMKKLAAAGYLADIRPYCDPQTASRAISYRGMHFARGKETLNKPGKGKAQPFALPLNRSHKALLRNLTSKDGSPMQIGVFNGPPHPKAIRKLFQWAQIS